MYLALNISDITDKITAVNETVNSFIWGTPLLILLIGTGIFFTLRLKVFQITKAKYIFKETVGSLFEKDSEARKSGKGSISQFQAVSTILAATIGTGNIAGVATAITAGGPGAVFWMWISAFFGMMTMYAEGVLAVFFRKRNKAGEWTGGTMYTLEEGLKTRGGTKRLAKPLGVMFAVMCVIASFGIGNMTQSNSISDALKTNFGVPLAVSGFAVAFVTGIVIFGGIKKIGAAAEKIMPAASLFYIAAALIIIFKNSQNLQNAALSVLNNAFSLRSIGGGIGGYAVSRALSFGLRRGVFSNEAGLGSSATLHAASDAAEPAVQGMWGIFAVFVDTILICSLTAFALLSVNVRALPIDAAAMRITEKGTLVALSTLPENSERDGAMVPLILREPLNDDDAYREYEGLYGVAYGKKVKIIPSDDFYSSTLYNRYTNVAVLRGIAKVDAKGMKILDGKGRPIIEYAELAPLGGVGLVSTAFSSVLGSAAGKIIAISIFLFAFATLLGWSYNGGKALEYLLNGKGMTAYKFIFTLFIIIGAVCNLELAWSISDTFNGLMAIPNLIGLILLSGTVVKITENYLKRKSNRQVAEEKPMLSNYADLQAEAEKRV